MPKTILIVDDSELILSMLEMICTQLGHATLKASDMTSVPAIVASQTPDVIISDLNLPDVQDPITALRQLPQLAQTPIIIVSGTPQAELDALAARRGAQGAISKDAGLPGMMMQLGPLLDALS
jgi:CheY-like chemotaxis protein